MPTAEEVVKRAIEHRRALEAYDTQRREWDRQVANTHWMHAGNPEHIRTRHMSDDNKVLKDKLVIATAMYDQALAEYMQENNL